ncbi:hypothetical protein BDR06DRAFT_1039201 [Suillus hirtellus]|nr:hypothetical protein BDR06DRAFT_1039201 [Suillus hirtellus]
MLAKTQPDVRVVQEDIQTSHDADLFNDEDMEDSASQPANQCEKLDTLQYNMSVNTIDLKEPLDNNTGQPPTWRTQSDKREASQMDLDDGVGQSMERTPFDESNLRLHAKPVATTVSQKRCIKEVDYSEALREIVYNQTERINNMRREMETDTQRQQLEYWTNMDESKKRWEAALGEREEQLAMARKELEDSRAQQQQQLEDHIRESGEALRQANQESMKVNMQKILDDSREQLTKELARREGELGQELVRREDELNRKKTEEFRERENMMLTEVERRLQREVDKLKARILFYSLMCRMLKFTHQADKDSELANMEQRFTRRHGLQDHDMEIDSSPSRRKDAGQPSTPSAKPSPGTPCLDAIKKIKRSRGISRRTRLVSVTMDADEEVPQDQSFEQDIPPHQQHTTPIVSMEDAIARGVEAAMRRIFVDKELPVANKRSPRRRKREEEEVQREKAAEVCYERDFVLKPPLTLKQGEVRRLFKDVFGFSQDADFIVYEPASRQDVHAYEYEDGPGPDRRNPTFDLQNGSKSPWNSKIIDSLLKELQNRASEENWPFQRSEAYFKEILQHRYKRLRTIWTAAQPKITAKGALETPAEVEERLITKKDETLKSTRQTTRRKNKYLRRVTVLDHLVKQTSDENREDLQAWQWLQKLVKTMGEGGMSSEESDVENQIETVLCVKNMVWRHTIERELDIVDNQRLMDNDIFAPQGSKPMKWIRATGNPTTSRAEVDGLPKALYNDEWLAGLTKCQVERLNLSAEIEGFALSNTSLSLSQEVSDCSRFDFNPTRRRFLQSKRVSAKVSAVQTVHCEEHWTLLKTVNRIRLVVLEFDSLGFAVALEWSMERETQGVQGGKIERRRRRLDRTNRYPCRMIESEEVYKGHRRLVRAPVDESFIKCQARCLEERYNDIDCRAVSRGIDEKGTRP